MTMDTFKLRYCDLMEHYQFIENHLEEIYAAASGKSYFQSLDEVENMNLNGIINALRELEKTENIDVLPTSVFRKLDEIRKTRNFWSHNCFLIIATKFHGNLEVISDDVWISRQESDLHDALEMRKYLYDRKIDLIAQKSMSRSQLETMENESTEG